MILSREELMQKHFREVRKLDLKKARLYIEKNLIRAAQLGNSSVTIALPSSLVFTTSYPIQGVSQVEMSGGRIFKYSNVMEKYTMEELGSQMLTELKEAGYEAFLVEANRASHAFLSVTLTEKEG